MFCEMYKNGSSFGKDALDDDSLYNFSVFPPSAMKLADQLEGLLSQRYTSTQNEHQIAINPENISCFKCNKNCRTRSTYCTTGKHWIHYRCQKLTEIEIKKVEKTRPTEEYTCKL